MSTSSQNILQPDKTVTTSKGDIVVREMAGLDAIKLFTLIAKHGQNIFAACIQTEASIDERTGDTIREQKFAFDLAALIPKIHELVFSVEELIVHIVTKSVADKDALTKYGTLDTMKILDAAIEVNVTPDHIEMAKTVGGRIVTLFSSAQTNDTQPPATS